jgi:hypothetical protein
VKALAADAAAAADAIRAWARLRHQTKMKPAGAPKEKKKREKRMKERREEEDLRLLSFLSFRPDLNSGNNWNLGGQRSKRFKSPFLSPPINDVRNRLWRASSIATISSSSRHQPREKERERERAHL